MWELRNALMPNGKQCCIQIHKDKIVSISDRPVCPEWIDAMGMPVLPGVIDGHVHFRTPGAEHKEDWETGSRAALYGGVTTVIDMPNTPIPLTLEERIEEKLNIVGNPPIDYRFNFGATKDNLQEIINASQHDRINGVKIYMGSSTGDLLVDQYEDQLRICESCAKEDILVMCHAENEEIMRHNRELLGRDPEITDHCQIRSTTAEVEQIKIAIDIQRRTGCRMLICHVSTPEGLELIHDAKERGQAIFAEVCVHHLYFFDERLQDEDRSYFKMNPPLRTIKQMKRLVELTCTPGYVDVLATDHAPHTRKEKDDGRYDQTPSGVTGVQTFPQMAYELVHRGMMSLQHFLDLTSGNAASLYNLPNKGRIKPEADADLIVLNTNVEFLIQNGDQETKCGWTPFHGWRVYSRPEMVIAQGMLYRIP